MEKYFIISEDSSLYKNYFKWKSNEELVREHVKKFFENHGISAKQYIARNKELYIIPTKDDMGKFEKYFTKQVLENGLRKFKINSKIGKEWTKLVQENELNILSKPRIGFYFPIYGRHSVRLFDIDKTLYCSIDSEYKFDKPEWAKEIKASEFWKVVEDYNESIN